jgi:hypothetical protein
MNLDRRDSKQAPPEYKSGTSPLHQPGTLATIKSFAKIKYGIVRCDAM